MQKSNYPVIKFFLSGDSGGGVSGADMKKTQQRVLLCCAGKEIYKSTFLDFISNGCIFIQCNF